MDGSTARQPWLVCTLFAFGLLALLISACNPHAVPGTEQPLPLHTVAESTPTKIVPETFTPDVSISSLETATATRLPYITPAWFREAILYEIFVRSFADGGGNGMGDLQGIISRLDYLQDLGINTLWLMPIYPSPSVHGYDVTDYLAVNPDYGTLQDMQALVDALHSRQMRLILDFVPSHISNQHPLFQEAYKNPASPHSEWFVWTNEAHTTYAGFAGSQEMPRFNHYNPEVVEYLIQSALFWLDLDGDGDYTDGVDGFRVDNATFPPQEFLIAFRQALKSANPEAILLGETWVHTASDLSRYFPDQFDALFDFPLYEVLQGSQDTNKDGLLAGKGFPVLLTAQLQDQANSYPPEAIPVRFLSNHDTNRIANEVGGDIARQKLAAALLAGLPGPVMLYYGEEIGMPGQKGGPPYWDNYRREPMDWYADEKGRGQAVWFQPPDRFNQPLDGISVEEQEDDPASLLNTYRQVFHLRASHVSLLWGDYRILKIEASDPGTWAITRNADGESVVEIYNFSAGPRQITINDFPISGVLVDLISGVVYEKATAGQPYNLEIPPASALWLTGE